jgi:hypothetical protein
MAVVFNVLGVIHAIPGLFVGRCAGICVAQYCYSIMIAGSRRRAIHIAGVAVQPSPLLKSGLSAFEQAIATPL